ncbi:MAG: MFS transporter [Proteobacteria bacterium]|nr:MFS transporter [Pseudomonadota bacterium]
MASREQYGYAIVAASFVIQAVTVGGMFTYGVLFPELISTFGWSRATIAAAASVTTLTMGFMGVVSGRMSDRFGPRVVLTISALSYGSGFMLMSLLEASWQLYVFWGLLVGIGLSTHDVVTLSTIARWFPRRRGLFSGVVKVGTAVGQLSIPLIAVALVATLGWRTACLVIGAAAMLLLFAAAQVMRRDPKSMGYEDSPAATTSSEPAAPPSQGSSYRSATRSPQFWILCGSQSLVFGCLLTITIHIVPHGIDLGLSHTAAASLLASIGAISMLGRVAVGSSVDRIGGRRALRFAYMGLLASLLWLQIASSAWMLFVFVAIYGIAHGGFFTVTAPTVAELFGTRAHGALFGTVQFFGSLGGAIGPLAAGYLFDSTGSYRIAFAALAALATVGLLLVGRLRPPRLPA